MYAFCFKRISFSIIWHAPTKLKYLRHFVGVSWANISPTQCVLTRFMVHITIIIRFHIWANKYCCEIYPETIGHTIYFVDFPWSDACLVKHNNVGNDLLKTMSLDPISILCGICRINMWAKLNIWSQEIVSSFQMSHRKCSVSLVS